MGDALQLASAASAEQLEEARSLFRAYARELGEDLCFQGFEAELAGLPGKYGPPDGRLILAACAGQIAGCVALRRLSAGDCEMKRLYVPPGFRGRGIGRALAEAVVSAARQPGYRRMVLDTLARLRPALRLYELLGFRPVAPYYENPLDEVVYLGLDL